MGAMTMKFQKAARRHQKLRLALVGPTGSGKTYSALSIARWLDRPVAVIDSERGSASLYADEWRAEGFEYSTLPLDSVHPDTYVEAIQLAASSGFGTLIIDSLSHAWMGKDGALAEVDRIAKASTSGNNFTAWRDVTPMHNRLIDAILTAPMHVIVTMRAKMEYVVEKDEKSGRTTVRKIGIQPEQRAGLEFEFGIVGDLNLENELTISKTRCSALRAKTFPRPGKAFAEVVSKWLDEGAADDAGGEAVPPKFADILSAISSARTLDALGATRELIVTARKARTITPAQFQEIVDAGTARRADIEVAEMPADLFAEKPETPVPAAAVPPTEVLRDPSTPDTGTIPHAKSDEAPLPPVPPSSAPSAAVEPEPPYTPTFTPEGHDAKPAPADDRDVDDEDCRLRERILNLDAATDLERSAVERDVAAWCADPIVPERFSVSLRGFLQLNTRKLPEVAKPQPVGASTKMKGAA